jgi:hypothetical protein
MHFPVSPRALDFTSGRQARAISLDEPHFLDTDPLQRALLCPASNDRFARQQRPSARQWSWKKSASGRSGGVSRILLDDLKSIAGA